MTADLFDFKAEKEGRTPHLSGSARCLACQHEWVAVAPVGSIWLECPACSLIRGRYFEPAEKPARHWTCNCGCDLFHVTPNEIYCPNCGKGLVA